ncbi:EI24 domain-containing protein [Iodidimonas sp. SYSU 1G8]|uniref:EI24 domain-containing protein n=1 Tax=Iodidimonas sp. SYSU 1G8 TaxID=3133967 RepID=UPI0031FF0BB4
MFQALGKSFALFGDRTFWATAFKALLLTVPLAALAAWAAWQGFEALPDTRYRLLNYVIDAIGAVGSVFIGLLLFPALASMVTGLFLDDIAEATERRFYPADAPGRPVGLADSVRQGIRLALLVIGVNLLVLPFYIAFLFVPPLGAALYFTVNGWLLSREYFGMVASRHAGAAEQKALRRRRRGRIFLAGCVLAGLFAVPVLNLAAPLIGTAFMVHIFKGVAQGAIV